MDQQDRRLLIMLLAAVVVLVIASGLLLLQGWLERSPAAVICKPYVANEYLCYEDR